MFAPLFCRRKEVAVNAEEREKEREENVGLGKENRPLRGHKKGGIEGKTRRQPRRSQDEEGVESCDVTGG